MSNKPFKIYRSSAGSGKTYTLVKEYLRLALRRPHYYKHILAVTFTNKATAEMKARIVESLSDFVKGEPNPMAEELKALLKLDDAQFQKNAQQVLTAILHGYAHFSVTTIDTFFQKIIRSFAKEVGLYGGFKLELEEDKVLDTVVDYLVDDIKEQEGLTKWLVNFAEEKVDEGKSWDVKRDIKALGKELFGETLKSVRVELEEFTKDREAFVSFQEQLQAIISTFRTEMTRIGNEALQAMESAGLQVVDFAYGKAGVANHFNKIVNGEYEYGKRVEGALDNPEAWYTKTSPHKDIIEHLATEKLIELLNKVVNHYDSNKKEYLSAYEVSKHLKSFAVLADVSQQLQQYKADEGVMLISDAGEFLHRIVADNDAPFVYEKVGSFYNHYLIDEFQDTSGFQWGNFYPLVENGISEGKMSMIVGDAKQSIYRWRGGDPMILQSGVKQKVGEHYIQDYALDTNYRSAEKVIAFNNLLFKEFADYLPNLHPTDNEWVKERTADISQVYEDVKQKTPLHKQEDGFKGYVDFSFYQTDKEEDIHWKDHALEQLPYRLEQLQDQGVAIEDIAILVRKAADAKLVMDYIMLYQQQGYTKEGYSYALISNESLLVSSATVVQVVMNVLRYLQTPKDQVAQANVVYSYHARILHSDAHTIHELLAAKDISGYLPESFTSRQQELVKMPLYDLIEELIRMFNLSTFDQERAYLQALQDVVLEYSSTQSNDLNRFLEWWEENEYKQKVKLPSSVKAAQVMTVHKSKGLQFKAVIVPFINWTVDQEANKGNTIWTKSEVPPYDQLPIIPLKYGKGLADTVFAKDYHKERLSAYLDNLNVLYVAFTRAEEYLIGYSQKPGKSISKVSDVIYQLFTSNEHLAKYWNEEEQRFCYGALQPSIEKTSEEKLEAAGEYVSNAWNDKLKVKYRGEHYFGDAELTGVSFGNLLHELMSRVVTLDQLPKSLDAMQYEGLIDERQKAQLTETTNKLIDQSQIREWFDPSWKVKTEVPILPASGEMSRLDRVMISPEKSVIVDYKTGAPKSSDVKQVTEYKKLLTQMGHEHVEGYLLYMDKMEVVEV